MPTPVGQVKVTIYKEENKTEADLDVETAVKYNYLKNLLNKVIESSKDENLRRLLLALAQQFNIDNMNELIYMCISCLAIPKFFHKYGFLLLQVKSENIQELIEILDPQEKLEKTTKIFSDFCNKIDLWEKLEDEYDLKKEKTKATEKLHSIYESLKTMFESSKDEKNVQVERFKKNLEGKNVPEHIMSIITEEMDRYMSMDKHSMESNVIRNYLDILTGLPYGISTEENLDIIKASTILNESHYGMEDVKERILQSIAVGKLKGKIQGKILCFFGPPGVGKTSIGESIAKSLNRKFIRISLGGDRDTSSLKGFRRTYVGAIPGKIVKALKTCGSENPVIMLDEIDKLAERSVHGDPSSVLLEILDPEQNHSFTDDYLDTPIDLSKVFFICTANNVQTINQALYDRMEIIEVSGYTFNEKKYIFEKYLRPRAIKNAGLDEHLSHSFSMSDETVNKLINDYCRESGVRSLQRYTNRIFEKIAMKIVQNDTDVTVTPDNLRHFIGGAHFSSRKIYERTPKGVSIGLGFNNYGGTILYVEASKANFSEKTTGQYNFTGNVGKVMGESVNIALTYAKYFVNTYLKTITEDDKKVKGFFDENHIHIHFTEGAIAKDGPSAGVAIATALLSLAMKKPILQDFAMTGELSLGGKVLTIGGVKEKVMAAQREGMKFLAFPRGNKDDIDELPEYIKQGLTIYYADDYLDIFRICFPGVEVNIPKDDN
jgi:Lon-like ATP-dependent protease